MALSLWFLTILAGPSLAAEPRVLDPVETTALLTRMAETREALGPRQMHYTETRSNPLLVHPVRQSGTLAFAFPNRFRKDSADASLISDGTQLWIFYPDLSETEHYPLGGNSPLARELQTLLAGFQPQALQRVFHVTARELETGYSLQLVPRRSRQTPIREIRSRWSRDLEIEALEMFGEDGSHTALEFSRHAPLRITAETFAPPKKP
jgi:outer membrane lipoprotein-sorting protein